MGDVFPTIGLRCNVITQGGGGLAGDMLHANIFSTRTILGLIYFLGMEWNRIDPMKNQIRKVEILYTSHMSTETK